jgi:alpha-tubulin suppressor-like RCC1 family protein
MGDTTGRAIPTLIPTLSNVTQVVAGQSHTLVVTMGNVYSFGLNTVSSRLY